MLLLETYTNNFEMEKDPKLKIMARIYKFAIDWSIEARDYEESMIYCKNKINLILPWDPNADLCFDSTPRPDSETDEEFEEDSGNLSEQEQKKERKRQKEKRKEHEIQMKNHLKQQELNRQRLQ